MLPGLLVLLALPLLALVALSEGSWLGGEWLVKWIQNRRSARARQIESELDQKQDELRATILTRADALGMEAHEARKALIRESFMASGNVPPEFK